MDTFLVLVGVVIYVFGYVMGMICASKKRRNKDSDSSHIEPCDTFEDVINREG